MCLESEGLGNPYTVASIYDAINMTSIPTVEVIRTSLVAIRHDVIVRRQTPELEYRFL